MKLTSYIVVGLTLASILASCGNNSKKGKDGRTDTYSSGTISFVSDESFSPIIEEEREVFQHDYPDAKVNPIYTNESDGINMLLHGKTWLVFAARDFKPAEQKSLEAQQYMPTSFSIAYDALERNESCGGHFREESQTEEGEAKRDDEHYMYVACWEYQGENQAPTLYKEPLNYQYIKVQTRNYKS